MALWTTARSEILADAIQDADAAGVTVVAAAGNNGTDTPVYPAALESVIAVGAVNRKSQPTQWTSFGPWVDVAAPGEGLFLPAGADGYATSNGTSWACAIVSGTVALLLQVNPKLSPAAIKKLLIETAHPSRGDKAGINVVDAYLAAYRTGHPSVEPSSPSDLTPATASPRRRKARKK
jgi:subtilisin family serine protease